jgi:CheY-like chemotaxis protein
VSDLANERQRLATASGAFCAAATRVSSRLDQWASSHVLRRGVLVVDDSPPALLALVAAIVPTGLGVHACVTDAEAVTAIVGLGATAHVIHCCGDASSVWRRVRSSVVVVDAHLGRTCGADVLSQIGRGPRAVLVSSRVDTPAERDSITDAARVAHATPVLRTDTGEWAERLRAAVLAAADEATPAAEAR